MFVVLLRYSYLTLLVVCSFSISCLQASEKNWLPIHSDSEFLQQISLSGGEQYRASYTQLRQLKIMNKPLESHGELLLTLQNGVLWQQHFPIKQTLIVTPKKVQQLDNEGELIDLPEAAEHMLSAWAPMMQQVILGQWQAVSKQFEVLLLEGSSASSWQIKLMPKDSKMQGALNDIELRGSAFLNSIQMHQANDDQLTIHLVKSEERSLSEQELSWLNE